MERIALSHSKYLQNLKKEETVEPDNTINEIFGNPLDEEDPIINQDTQKIKMSNL